ncbi:unnamed protein product, partial [Rotaria socialis]
APERIVPIEREQPAPPPPPPRTIRHDATTSTHDLYIPRPPTPKLGEYILKKYFYLK